MTELIAVPRKDAGDLTEMVRVEIDPDALYTAAEAAIIIGIRGSRKSRQGAMYSIPVSVLPRIRTGPNGGLYRWLGRDLLAYRNGQRET